jgi:hypothetical protein
MKRNTDVSAQHPPTPKEETLRGARTTLARKQPGSQRRGNAFSGNRCPCVGRCAMPRGKRCDIGGAEAVGHGQGRTRQTRTGLVERWKPRLQQTLAKNTPYAVWFVTKYLTHRNKGTRFSAETCLPYVEIVVADPILQTCRRKTLLPTAGATATASQKRRRIGTRLFLGPKLVGTVRHDEFRRERPLLKRERLFKAAVKPLLIFVPL